MMQPYTPSRTLIIQTAFPGDVILATSVAESLHRAFPEMAIDFLVKEGNEQLFRGHPFIGQVITLQKNGGKLKSFSDKIKDVRGKGYDLVLNLHRFFSSGLITTLSGAKEKRGFRKNPLSSFYDKAFPHVIGDGRHETDRNFELIKDIVSGTREKPRLYPGAENRKNIEPYCKRGSYICIAPASVWPTKQFPVESWKAFMAKVPEHYSIYLIGAPGDHQLASKLENSHCRAQNLCGNLSLLDSAALMQKAEMNYVNDSAPLHLCSALNAPVAAIFCSTVPAFGFGPLSDHQFVIETPKPLECRPCGLHGHKKCPEGHFLCAYNITSEQLLKCLN